MEADIDPLHRLAEAIGLSRTWRDVAGAEHIVSDTSLAIIATALGYPAETESQIAGSINQVNEECRVFPVMIVTEIGIPTTLPGNIVKADLTAEDGTSRTYPVNDGVLPAIDEPGYYRLTIGGSDLVLAVAPKSCPEVPQFAPGKVWGPAVQIPALRGKRQHAFGNFEELDNAVRLFAARGADVLAINPVHALFPGNGDDFSPYSPSSRLYLNTAMGAPELVGLPRLPAHDGGSLIDWQSALPRHLSDLRNLFGTLDNEIRTRISRANDEHGKGIRRQALFDTLDVHFRATGANGWHQWPEAFHEPDGPAATAYAAEHHEEVEFHLFAQWLARESLAKVQSTARDAGMAVGLLSDLAVGVHTGGADTWSMRSAMLQGLTIGAPPDPLGPHGQNWMLSGFSPLGLRRTGYAPWIDTIRAALTVSGGTRIDHAFGLSRLWVVPQCEASREGAYLAYPFMDLVRLVALEAHRANALIVAEDLGTMPGGFAGPMAEKKMLGMRVLWFERAADEGFIGGQDYPRESVAMTGTHDTATVAGWWTSRDLSWAQKLDRLPANSSPEEAEQRRTKDRRMLWSTLTHDTLPRPEPNDPEPVVAAALRHIGRSASQVAIAPLEDILAQREQPNLPGTITEHPNWRRRLPAPLGELLDDPATSDRMAIIDEARKIPN